MYETLKKGLYPGGVVPFGYRVENKHVYINEEEAQLTEVEDKITIEQYKVQNQLKKEQVVEYLTHTIRQSPRLLIKNLIQKIVVYDDRFEIYYNYLNRMPPKTDDIGDKSIAETPPNTCSDISKDSSPKRGGKYIFPPRFGNGN